MIINIVIKKKIYLLIESDQMDSAITDITRESNEINEMPSIQNNSPISLTQPEPMNIIEPGHYTNKMLDQNINFGSNYSDEYSQMDMVIDSYSNNQNQETMSPPTSQSQNIVDVNTQKQNLYKPNRYIRQNLKSFM